MERPKGCQALIRDAELTVIMCCTSCHDESDDMGREMIEVQTHEGFYDVCCHVQQNWEEIQEGG